MWLVSLPGETRLSQQVINAAAPPAQGALLVLSVCHHSNSIMLAQSAAAVNCDESHTMTMILNVHCLAFNVIPVSLFKYCHAALVSVIEQVAATAVCERTNKTGGQGVRLNIHLTVLPTPNFTQPLKGTHTHGPSHPES